MIDHPCDRIESILLTLYTFYDFTFMSEDGELTCTQFWMQYTLGKEAHICCVWVDLLHIMLALLISYLAYKWAKDRHANFMSFKKAFFKMKFNDQKNIQTWWDGFLVWNFVLYLLYDDAPSPTLPHCAPPHPTLCTSCESKLPDGTPNCALLPNLSIYAFSPILKSTIWFDLIPKG
jgi:hypothetical protein